MKKTTAIRILFPALFLFFVWGCKKENTNPFSDVSNFSTGAYIILDSTLNTNLNFSQITTSEIGIKVSQFPGGQDVDKIQVFAVQGATYDTTEWKLVKTVPYTGNGTVLTVTGAELGTALGVAPTDLAPGSNYTFYNRVFTKSGQSFDVNNTSDNGGSGFVNGPTYNGALTFAAYIVCPFVAPVGGTYKVLRDDWADWSAGDLVEVKDGPAGSNTIDLSQVWPNPGYNLEPQDPLIVKIDPTSGVASVPKVHFADYGSGADMTAENGNAGFVFSCTGYIKLTMNLVADGPNGSGADYGPYTLILQKQ